MKKETLEEVATKEGLYRCSQHNFNQAVSGYNAKWFKRGAIFGAKWQQERSEYEAIQFADWILDNSFEMRTDNHQTWWGKFNEEKDYTSKELFEQFKKKLLCQNSEFQK